MGTWRDNYPLGYNGGTFFGRILPRLERPELEGQMEALEQEFSAPPEGDQDSSGPSSARVPGRAIPGRGARYPGPGRQGGAGLKWHWRDHRRGRQVLREATAWSNDSGSGILTWRLTRSLSRWLPRRSAVRRTREHQTRPSTPSECAPTRSWTYPLEPSRRAAIPSTCGIT